MFSSYLAERDQESTEVTGGVAADGILQVLPVLCGEGIVFKENAFICITFASCLGATL